VTKGKKTAAPTQRMHLGKGTENQEKKHRRRFTHLGGREHKARVNLGRKASGSRKGRIKGPKGRRGEEKRGPSPGRTGGIRRGQSKVSPWHKTWAEKTVERKLTDLRKAP